MVADNVKDSTKSSLRFYSLVASDIIPKMQSFDKKKFLCYQQEVGMYHIYTFDVAELPRIQDATFSNKQNYGKFSDELSHTNLLRVLDTNNNIHFIKVSSK